MIKEEDPYRKKVWTVMRTYVVCKNQGSLFIFLTVTCTQVTFTPR